MSTTIEEAREILKDKTLTDDQLTEIINSLQLLVELMFDGWTEEQKNNDKLYGIPKPEVNEVDTTQSTESN